MLATMTYGADTWFTRDLPVLKAIAEHCDAPEGIVDLRPQQLPELTGLDIDAVKRSLAALIEADPPYITGVVGSEGRYPSRVGGITSEARRALGMWPSPEPLADRLVAALNTAADAEPDPQRSSRLRDVAGWLGGAARDLGVEISAALISRNTGGL